MTASTNMPAAPAAIVRGGSARGLLLSVFEWFGELAIFCWRLARAAVVPPLEVRELIRQMDAIGSKSLPWWRSPARPPA